MRASRTENSAPGRWVLWLWVIQLAIPVTILLYAVRRLTAPPLSQTLTAFAAVSALWLLVGCACIVTPRGRLWLTRHRQRLALALGSACMAALIADVTLTMTGIVPTIQARRQESLRFRHGIATRQRLVPNQPALQVNDRGFRSPNVTIPKPAWRTRILFLGGSQVFAHRSGNWPLLVGEELNAIGLDVDIVNAGVPGHQTVDSVGKLLTDAWVLQPDVIVLCQAWNDIKYFRSISRTRPYRDVHSPWRSDWRVDPTGLDMILSFSSVYRIGRNRLVMLMYGDEGIPISGGRMTGRVQKLAVRQYQLSVEAVCDLGTSIGAVVVLCKQPRLATKSLSESDRELVKHHLTGLPYLELVRAFAECDQVIEVVGRRKGCKVINLHSLVSGRRECFHDHIHLTEQGGRMVAEAITAEIKGLAAANVGTRSVDSQGGNSDQ